MRLDRLNQIERFILKKGNVTWEEMSDQFQVSINTLRRDISELMLRGKITKVYGGVASLERAIANTFTLLPAEERAGRSSAAKKRIGELAASFVEDGMTLILDSGTTVPYILPHLAQKKEITIVTHSLLALYEAAKYPALSVLALGGTYNHDTSSYGGISTLNVLSGITTDLVFVAATGVSLENGLTHTTFFEAETKRRIVASGRKTILMADDSKFGQSSMIRFMDFSDLDAIVTNTEPPEEFVREAEKANIALVCR